jgi:glyoxylase-like metal-dependent hydrolase (beta-lactamase superfamily II)
MEGLSMEVRLVGHGPGKLATKVFFSDEAGFAVASVIVMGKNDAILIDTQWTRSNAHRVVAEILETGKKLKYIFITHAHPDHYFGTGHIAEEFPDAKVVALKDTAELVNKQFFGKLEHWESVIGSHNVCRKECKVEVLDQNYLELEGERLEIIPNIVGDMINQTMVWIPSIKTLYGSDVLFNQSHPFTCEVTAEERKLWLKALDDIEKMGAEVIIPGHQKPGMPFDLSSVYFTREYIIANDEELERTDDVESFFYNMFIRFPEANLRMLSLEMNANVFKGGRDWNWRAL